MLTCFVAGTNSGCSKVGELQNMDLGGRLELSQLGNVKRADAQAAGLGNKKRLTELELRWADSDQEAHNNNHKEALEGLKPHDGLKVLRVHSYGSRTFPTWMNTLKGMVELKLFRCKNLKELPALWELHALQILRLEGLKSLQCLCSGGTTPVTFPKLKVLLLYRMPEFEAWRGTDDVQGEEVIFPKVEELEIKECGSLTSLPKGLLLVKQSFGGLKSACCRSAFPALRKLKLSSLSALDRWGAAEETLGEELMFPQLEKLSISSCRSLSALPKGTLLIKQSFGGAKSVCCRSAFPALRKLELFDLPSLERWGAVEGTTATFPHLFELSISSCRRLSALPKGSLLVKQTFGAVEVHGEGPIFSKVEMLSIRECGGLTALPKAASVFMESSVEVDAKCRSAFPALRKMTLSELDTFQRWEEAEGTLGEAVMFPQLEELSIWSCRSLSALPKGSLLVNKQSFEGAETVLHRSAFPALRKLSLSHLSALERCGAAEGTPGEEVTFPLLEDLNIYRCPKLTDLPEAPKLSKLVIQGDNTQIWSLHAANRHIPSLSSLTLDASPHGRWVVEEDRVTARGYRKVPLPAMWLISCDLLFSHSSALALWRCLAQLVDLEIWNCGDLEYWPENVFVVLVCLRNLSIFKCSELTGRTQASGEQSAPAPERGLLPAYLESLEISKCESLIEVPNLPGSLKTLRIDGCIHNVNSIVFSQQEDTRLVGGEGVVQPSSLIPGSSSSEATASTAVLKPSSVANHLFLPCLESLRIEVSSEVTNVPPSVKTLVIWGCDNLQSLSGQLDAIQKLTIGLCSRLGSLEKSCFGELQSLEKLDLYVCKSLASLPDGPQAYSYLRVLAIRNCDGIKLLPWSLQSHLDYLEEKDLDAHYEEPKTQKCAIRSLVCLPRPKDLIEVITKDHYYQTCK